MCINKDLLVRFYSSINFSLRNLIHFRVLSTYGKPFDQFLVEEPWAAYDVLTRAMGKHNADLFVNMLRDWLEKNGCRITVEEVKKFLSSKEAWL
ncbi:MAG: hypothetical protein ABWK05_06210 [Pyrobaculum sp.]